jgi:hypothetical protein
MLSIKTVDVSDQKAYCKSTEMLTAECLPQTGSRTLSERFIEVVTSKKIAGITTDLTSRKSKNANDDLSNYNMKKLSVLLALFDSPKSLSEIVEAIPRRKKTEKEHYDSIKSEIHRLRRTYTHPYISHQIRKGHYRYFLTKKGQRICCELFYRLQNRLTLHIFKYYKTTCHHPCAKCEHNPKSGSFN